MNKKAMTWIRRHIFKDIWRRLIALTLAVLTWMFLHLQQLREQSIVLPLTIDYDSSVFYLSSNTTQNVTLIIQSHDQDISPLTLTTVANYDLYLQLPAGLDRRKSGTCRFTVGDIKCKNIPDNTSIVKMIPESLEVPYDVRKTAVVPIQQPPSVQSQDKLKLFKFIDMQPLEASISGPSDTINQIKSLSLIPLTPEQLVNSPSRMPRDIANPAPSVVSIEPRHVVVSVKLDSLVMNTEKEVERVPQVLGLKSVFRLVSSGLSPVKLLIKGTEESMVKLDLESVMLYVKLDHVSEPGNVQVPICVGGLPSGVTFTLSAPDIIVGVEKIPAVAPEGESPSQ